LKSLKLRLESGNIPGQASCYHNIAVAYNELGKYSESVKASENGLRLSIEIGDIESMRLAHENLANVYGKMGSYKQAYENHVRFKQLHDSIFNVENSKALGDMKTDFEVQKKEVELKAKAEAEKEKLQAISAMEKSKQRVVIWFLFGGIALVILTLVIVFNRFRITRQQKRIIEDQKVKVDQAFDALNEKNKEVLDSIYYAKRIQQALITSEIYIGRKLKELKK
jgi:two-component system, sensor histidine kinase PdtaS